MKANIKQGGRLAVAVLFTVAGLAACGGGSDSPSPSPAPAPGSSAPPPAPAASNTVPASAGASVAAFIDYIRGLKSNETSQPVSIGQFAPPVDNTAAPTKLGS
ncbi:MAG: hypothetical protein ABIP08_08880 [Lautropia sp.]